MDGDNVGVVQGGGGTGFLDEAASSGLVRHMARGKDLDGNVASEAGGTRTVDLAPPHPPRWATGSRRAPGARPEGSPAPVSPLGKGFITEPESGTLASC